MSERVPVPPGYKRCSDCKTIKPATLDAFNRNAGRRGGLNGICRDCNRARCDTYNARVVAEAMRAYGGRCACCGTTRAEFLMLVTVGPADRSGSWSGGGFPMAFRLRKQGWPPGHRVLCANCRLATARDEEHTCLAA